MTFGAKEALNDFTDEEKRNYRNAGVVAMIGGCIVDTMAGCCFPANAMVNVTGKGTVPMMKLQVGDEVEAMTVAGFLTYSRVGFFLHRDPDQIAEFLCFTTDDGRELALTPDHQLGVVDDVGGGEVTFMFAADVVIGMKLVIPMTNFPQMVNVVSIRRQTFTGVYAPCTNEGTIVVSGCGCSCYAHVQHEEVHQSLKSIYGPMAQFPKTAQHAFETAGHYLGVPVARKVVSLGASVSNLWRQWKVTYDDFRATSGGDARCVKPMGERNNKLLLIN